MKAAGSGWPLRSSRLPDRATLGGQVDWSRPLRCDAGLVSEVPDGPVVYRMVLVDDSGLPRKVARFWSEDDEGVMLIGESVVGKTRFLELVAAVRGQRFGRGHGPGFTFHYWFNFEASNPDNLRFQWADLSGIVASITPTPDAGKVTQAAELLAIEQYRGRFGDLPPCNTQGPKWKAVTEWMLATFNVPWAYLPGQVARLNVPVVEAPGVPAISVQDAVEATRANAAS